MIRVKLYLVRVHNRDVLDRQKSRLEINKTISLLKNHQIQLQSFVPRILKRLVQRSWMKKSISNLSSLEEPGGLALRVKILAKKL